MEAGRRAGRAVIGNYRVVAHGGSRERFRERANKNASTLASSAPSIFLLTNFFRFEIRDNRGFARNNSNLLRFSRAREKARVEREKSPPVQSRERESDLVIRPLRDSRTTVDERNKHVQVSAPSQNGGRPIFREHFRSLSRTREISALVKASIC